jgi:transcriptional regulator with XRE-family HTH domain
MSEPIVEKGDLSTLEISLGYKVLMARKAAKKTQEECAEHLCIHRNTYGAKEEGKSEFSGSQLKKLENFLGTKIL